MHMGAAAVARHLYRTRAVQVTLCLRVAASCQSTPSEGARAALVYLSLCEDGFVVWQVQGVFENALSVGQGTILYKTECPLENPFF